MYDKYVIIITTHVPPSICYTDSTEGVSVATRSSLKSAQEYINKKVEMQTKSVRLYKIEKQIEVRKRDRASWKDPYKWDIKN